MTTPLLVASLYALVFMGVVAAITLSVFIVLGVCLWIDPREGGWFSWGKVNANTW